MKQTKNRLAIIKSLTEPNSDCGGAPPYSVSDIHYILESDYDYKPVSISQINRTLRDLRDAGLVICESRIDDSTKNRLPQRVNYWQMADAVDRNKLLSEVSDLCKFASRAHGILLFGGYCEEPMNDEQKNIIINDLKLLMQRTHPDRVNGYNDQFKQLQDSLVYVRSKVDLLKA